MKKIILSFVILFSTSGTALAKGVEDSGGRVYDLVPIALSLIVLYIISRVLLKKNILSLMNHRKIWNILLLITFSISGILGILLILTINFGTDFHLPFNVLFWHVEVGIAMFTICVFHISERWYYFKNVFLTKKS